MILIGKSANPRCFKNINKDALPVKYCAQKSAWMNSSIFSDWFINIFVPSVKKYLHDKNLPVKAILLLDNAPSHPSTDVLQSSDKSVTAMYLPANTTSLIQPMDQGVLETIKRHYKRDLLRKLLLLDEEGHSMVTYVKTINMKDVVYTSAASWEKITPLTLSKSWLKLLGEGHSTESDPPEQESSDDPSCEELAQMLDADLTETDIQEWTEADSNDPGHQLYTDEEIISQVTGSEELCSEEEDEGEEEEGSLQCVSSGQAADMLEQCLTWYENQPEATATSLMLLKQIRDLAVTKRWQNLKQSTLRSFVKQ